MVHQFTYPKVTPLPPRGLLPRPVLAPRQAPAAK
jgi:hypothetical protein